MSTITISGRNYGQRIAVLSAIVIAGIALSTMRSPDTVSRQMPQALEWRPKYCAAGFKSKDNVPLAVCGEVVYPVYDVPEGYVGLLRDCVKWRIGPMQECRPSDW